MNGSVGYAWLQQSLNAPDFLGVQRARMASASRLRRLPDGGLLVPERMRPEPNALAHALFAIKHEGVRLDYLAAALRTVPAEVMREEALRTPNGVYIRRLGLLWEQFNDHAIPGLGDGPPVSARFTPLLDPGLHVVGQSRRNRRWRVDVNGLGGWEFCPLVRLTPKLLAAQKTDVLHKARDFAARVGPDLLERALAWAYLSETEGSFAIERETPPPDKAAQFRRLLERAGDPQPLTEDYLAALQRATVTNPLDHAVQFRIEQNRLQGAGLGAVGVSYVPPAPDLAAELMVQLMAFANRPLAGVHPLVQAAALSFAFVFIHPFMDGNGRLSRFLLHHFLSQSNALPPGFLLPISVAMNRHEDGYLHALQSFSRPARSLCEVRWAGDEHYHYTWAPHADLWFRYMDLTEGVLFVLRMAAAALDEHLTQEVAFLRLFDAVARHINARHDLRGSDLATLIVTTWQNGGKLSVRRRKRFADRVQPQVLDAIEAAVARVMRGESLDAAAD